MENITQRVEITSKASSMYSNYISILMLCVRYYAMRLVMCVVTRHSPTKWGQNSM